MDKRMLNFFITCPKCKCKFGISAGVVLKYIDRLFGQLEEGLHTGFRKFQVEKDTALKEAVIQTQK